MTAIDGRFPSLDFELPPKSGPASLVALILVLADAAEARTFSDLHVEGARPSGWSEDRAQGELAELCGLILSFSDVDFLSLELGNDADGTAYLALSIVDGVLVSVLLFQPSIQEALHTSLKSLGSYRLLKRTRAEFDQVV